MKRMMQIPILFAAGVLLAAINFPANAQLIGTRQVADLNPGSTGSFPTNLVAFSGSLYFNAYTLATGQELWRYDGTVITLTSNINDTADDLGGVFEGNDSVPSWMNGYSNALYYSAFDPYRGGELWRYDGTNAARVADIFADANPSNAVLANPNSSWPSELTVLNGELFFSANGGPSNKANYELWKYNGLLASQVGNIHPDSGSDYSAYPNGLTPFDGALFFMATDGANGYELWKATGSGAILVSNLNAGTGDSFPKYFTAFSNRLYFQAFTGATGFELWRTDGTNTALVADLAPGTTGAFPASLTVFSNALYLSASDGTNGFELWKYDGAALSLVSNINVSGDAFVKNLTVFDGKLYFSATDGVNGWELWSDDGSAASPVTNLNAAGDAYPENLTVCNGALYFSATTPDTGYEVWKCQSNAVSLAADINPGPGDSFPRGFRAFGDALCFSAAADGLANYELWTLWPAPFRLTSIETVGADLRVHWVTLSGRTNVLQSSEFATGPFTNLSDLILTEGSGETSTNFTDAGGTTSAPARFYRVVQP